MDVVRATVRAGALTELTVDDLQPDDLADSGWSGSPTHLRSVRSALARVELGEVTYLAVRAPSGEPVAKGVLDFTKHGCTWAVIGVEDDNPRARALYERWGFRPFGTEHASWEQEDDTGHKVVHQAEVTLLRRRP